MVCWRCCPLLMPLGRGLFCFLDWTSRIWQQKSEPDPPKWSAIVKRFSIPEPTARVTLEKISFSKYRANCYASVERLHVFRYVVLTRRNFSVTGGAKVNIMSVKTYSAFYFLSAYQSLTASYPAKDVYQDFSTAWNPYQATFPQGRRTPVTVFFPPSSPQKKFFFVSQKNFLRGER